ncbi:hypothetical protein Tco_1433915, partial [Tanacetum coccineum]
MESLETISDLEENIREMEKRAFELEGEGRDLMNKLPRLESENDAGLLRYGKCLEKNSALEKKIVSSNKSLKTEAGDLAKRIMLKDQELSDKHDEMEKLQSYAKNEHTHYVQVEAVLETLQMLCTRSQEEQRNLALELKNGIQMVKYLEICKLGLEPEMEQVKGDNNNLKKTAVEIVGLKEMKQRLEEEVALELGQCSAMQQEIVGLKDELNELNTGYNLLIAGEILYTGINGVSNHQLRMNASMISLITVLCLIATETVRALLGYVELLLLLWFW